ncbi:tagatose 1,6-diphosphate aldolase [Athalassotoga saccharophila]|uniref:tagatose 1,6-diphosphate aldolase n=1 Tax=Athalassotoga saccharophila TaxID=1441386 RepID=UPI001379E6A5|nr:tagatose 1,6-diphosphate aldolase [Athalassotoga saccharophila]BBJ28197.1 tagatose 1,6-diphosphate aldolase [Athalassotoga saccharophila]
MKIQSGKYRGFIKISNEIGQFQMLALDQRNSIEKMVKDVKGSVDPEDLVRIKRSILKNLSDKVTAVLVDGEYGFPQNLRYVSRNSGIILSAEKSGYSIDPSHPSDRLSSLYREGVASIAKDAGLDAVKLLIYWSENSSDSTKSHQMKIVEELGRECEREDILYILEILTYNVSGTRSDAILKALETFSEGKYKVDLFKVEPIVTDAKDNLRSEDIYRTTRGKPWVVLSEGMDAEKFAEILDLNCRIGASGFLAGRAIWKKVVSSVDDTEEMDLHLKHTGTYNLNLIKHSSEKAVPFFNVPYFGGFENIEII